MIETNIVVVGGGTGNHTTLSGLRKLNCNLAAVVAMTDSGGSSGRLRDEMGHLPPGDLRQCLIALASEDHSGTIMKQLFDYRFSAGTGLTGGEPDAASGEEDPLYDQALAYITDNPKRASISSQFP